jgi:cyclohexadienyl dehydratase
MSGGMRDPREITAFRMRSRRKLLDGDARNWGWRPTAIALFCLFSAVAGARSAEPGVLRVGTSGDYAPFSSAVGGDRAKYEGFDIAVAQAYAADRGLEVRFVRFRWQDLLGSLAADRFDVAMSGITVRPERSAVGLFTAPVTETGAVILGRPKGRFRELAEYDRRPVRIGVNRGGHLERVASAHFAKATIVAIPDNAAVLESFVAGNLDAAVTDTLEAPLWMASAGDVDLHGPFTVDRKAYLVRPELPERAADLEGWLVAREIDGTLAGLRATYFGGGRATADPTSALLAAIDERLSLMPLVAVAKRRGGKPLEVPEREAYVLEAAVEGARNAALRAGAKLPDEARVRALFRAQMEAAKEVQWNAIRDPDFVQPVSVPDLDEALRPALIRIGERVTALLLQIPPNSDATKLREAAQTELRSTWLSAASKHAIADAIAALSPTETEPESDLETGSETE